MKYLINLTSDVHGDLTDGNFRGEPRWERNIVAACLSENRQVHLTREAWKTEQKPDNLYNGINQEWLNDSVLITHGISTKLHILNKANKYIVQFHEDPVNNVREEFLSYGNNIIATTDSKNPFTWDRLVKSLGADKLYYIPGPMVPSVNIGADNFKKPYMTWIYRNFNSFLEEKPSEIVKLFNYLSSILQQESNTRIKIIVGLWDIWGLLGREPDSLTLKNWAFSHACLKPFESFKNRIDFYANLHWREVIDLLKDTRYIISPAEPLGCPAFEAAIYGIPTIVNKEVNPFMTGHKNQNFFPEVLTSDRKVEGQFLNHINNLQTNHSFYLQHGNAYRNWVKNNATYSAYISKIEDIMTQRGWL